MKMRLNLMQKVGSLKLQMLFTVCLSSVVIAQINPDWVVAPEISQDISSLFSEFTDLQNFTAQGSPPDMNTLQGMAQRFKQKKLDLEEKLKKRVQESKTSHQSLEDRINNLNKQKIQGSQDSEEIDEAAFLKWVQKSKVGSSSEVDTNKIGEIDEEVLENGKNLRNLQAEDPLFIQCQSYASGFYATDVDDYSDDDVPLLEDLAGETVKCNFVKYCPTLTSDQSCTFKRKLQASCRQIIRNSKLVTRIRIQTNSFPDHCFNTLKVAPEENLIDFEVDYNSNYGQLIQTPITSQTQMDLTLCQSGWVKDYNLGRYFYQRNSGNLDYIVGISLNGVPIHEGYSVFGYDAYYPRRLSRDYPLRAVQVDECLGNADDRGYYHYYSVSPCLQSSNYKKLRVKNMCSDVGLCANETVQYALNYFVKDFAPIGIAKDGHIIIGPYKDDKTLWQPCEVDACNGVVNEAGEYSYVSTMFYPYTVGCWGPSNRRLYEPKCSANYERCLSSSGSILNKIKSLIIFVSLSATVIFGIFQ
eukprot:403363115